MPNYSISSSLTKTRFFFLRATCRASFFPISMKPSMNISEPFGSAAWYFPSNKIASRFFFLSSAILFILLTSCSAPQGISEVPAFTYQSRDVSYFFENMDATVVDPGEPLLSALREYSSPLGLACFVRKDIHNPVVYKCFRRRSTIDGH